ncbi:MAG TPA: HDOD domain-containing protein [Polyangiaceae bacterium]|jgi:putative nucleotidyltransferase with HDIG domain
MTGFPEFVPSQAPAGEPEQAALPSLALVEPTSEMSETERELVKRLRGGRTALPVLPQVAQSALRLANDHDARIGDLAELVDTDPPIAARFLSVANSVVYWRGLLTSSTQSAIVRLGLANTRDLLFQVVYAASAGGLKRYQSMVQASFKRSVVAAVAARIAARELGIQTDYDYMSGLLHDIGESRIYRILDAMPKPAEGPSHVKELVQRYHCAAGADVAIAWKLPAEIVDACAAHHDPQAAGSLHVRLVMIADAVVDAIQAGRSPDLEPFERLGVDVSLARKIIDHTAKASDPK